MYFCPVVYTPDPEDSSGRVSGAEWALLPRGGGGRGARSGTSALGLRVGGSLSKLSTGFEGLLLALMMMTLSCSGRRIATIRVKCFWLCSGQRGYCCSF